MALYIVMHSLAATASNNKIVFKLFTVMATSDYIIKLSAGRPMLVLISQLYVM